MNLNKKIALIRDILELSIEITSISDIDIFCDFSSHVKSFTVKIILNGWDNEGYETDLYKHIYLEWGNSESELQKVLDYLRLIKEEI